MTDPFSVAIDVAKIVSPITSTIIDFVASSNTSVNDASDKSLDDLKLELEKQKMRMEYDAHQAKMAQELAIAARIENAHEVEIEEYYDNYGKGHAGLSFDAASQTGSFGVGGEGRAVTKRIIRFKGTKTNSDISSESTIIIRNDR